MLDNYNAKIYMQIKNSFEEEADATNKQYLLFENKKNDKNKKFQTIRLV